MEKMKLNIQRFGASASISGQDYGGDPVTNKSYIRGSISISTSGQTHNLEGSAYYQINGGPAHYFSIGYNSTVTFSYDGLGPYTHNPDGTLSNQKVTLYVRITSSTSTSAEVWVTMNNIPRYATMTGANNFNDEGNPSFTYTNPANTSMSCWLEPKPNSTHLAVRTLSGTSGTYTWRLTEEERNQLRSACSNENSCKCRIGLYSTLGGNTQASYRDVTLSIINANPVFTDFEFEDANTVTAALTGNNKNNVNGYSNIKATISTLNKAEAQKGATMVKYRFIIDNQTIDIPYNDSESVDGTIMKSTGGKYEIYAIDSRGNSTLVTKLANEVVSYVPISLDTSSKAERTNGGIGEYATLNYTGTFWNKSFGQVSNSIQSASYQFKKTTDSQWITGTTNIMPTLSGSTFSFDNLVRSNNQDYTFDLQSSYDFKILISDKLVTKELQLTAMASGKPNISFADEGIGIMCDYDEEIGGALQVDGVKYSNIYSGTTTPSNNLGEDGDVYFQYNE